ncbi:MAG: LPS export ABC transporter periplasmic protein LptC [Crocinitomicaceae bacterium]|nr:LPS export ABC transporter periplasmic protein LptC [Crocinitomicaceae bacterium]
MIKKIILLLAFIRKVFFFIVITVFFLSCKNDISEIKAISDPQNLPVQTSINASYEYSEKGHIVNRLVAGKLDQYEGDQPYIEASNGFTMIFFDSLANETARLSAVHGKYFKKEEKLIAWGKVELINANKEKIETEELLYEQDSSKISTDKFVTITTPQGILYGKGMVSNDSFTKYRILQPTGDIYMNEKENSVINGKNN